MNRMLVLSRTLPWPLDRGEKIRLHSFLEAFRKKYEVKWISISSSDDADTLDIVREKFSDVLFEQIEVQSERGCSFFKKIVYPKVALRFYDIEAIKTFQQEAQK